MTEYLFVSIAVALVAAFVLLTLKKIGVVEWLQVHGSDLVSEMAHCDFCLSWWTCLAVALMVAATTQNPCIMLTAVLAAPITRKLQ